MVTRKKMPLKLEAGLHDDSNSGSGQAVPQCSAKPDRFRKAPRTLRETFDATEERSAATLDFLATH